MYVPIKNKFIYLQIKYICIRQFECSPLNARVSKSCTDAFAHTHSTHMLTGCTADDGRSAISIAIASSTPVSVSITTGRIIDLYDVSNRIPTRSGFRGNSLYLGRVNSISGQSFF